ncbi:MAG: hypothetical protein FJY19_07775 [Bacteroidetes bacterium]|nr:hypothetical protein [Bacteroidota bacterium]
MSEEEKVTATAESVKTTVGNHIATFLGLKEKNPKLFYGIIAVIGIPLLLIMFSGGESRPTVSGPTVKDLAVGQKYVLKAPNAVDANATVRLVTAPGELAAYDDSEEADRKGTCQHMPQSTPVEVLEFSGFGGMQKKFVKVKVMDGECKDKTGWVLDIDVQ